MQRGRKPGDPHAKQRAALVDRPKAERAQHAPPQLSRQLEEQGRRWCLWLLRKHHWPLHGELTTGHELARQLRLAAAHNYDDYIELKWN